MSVGTATTVLEVRNITVRFGGQVAVDDCSLDFSRGIVTGIIGPNGAGKSTLMNVIAGIQRPASGTVRLETDDITGKSPYILARRGLVRSFQHARVFGHMSVLDNLIVGVPRQTGDHFWKMLAGPRTWRAEERQSEERALSLLAGFRLDGYAHSRCSELSGGQRRIVEYLRVLMTEPRVLLLDEPSVGLAPWLVEKLSADLRRLSSEGCTVLLIEHEMNLIQKACDVIVGMVSGKPVVSGSFSDILSNETLQAAYLGRV